MKLFLKSTALVFIVMGTAAGCHSAGLHQRHSNREGETI